MLRDAAQMVGRTWGRVWSRRCRICRREIETSYLCELCRDIL